jgi:hypothetical protein
VTHGDSPPETKPNRNQKESETESETKTETNARDAFDRFWKAYPKKVGKDAARKAFAKVKAPVDVLLSAVEAQKRSRQWLKDSGQYIPNPATWLNQGRWEDELPEAGNLQIVLEDNSAKIARMRQVFDALGKEEA